MGTVARIRFTETKISVVVEQAASLSASVTDSSMAIWVGNTVPKVNQVELRTTCQRCWSAIKEKQRFLKPAASEYMVGSGALGVARGAVTTGSQAGTWAEEAQVAVVYGENFDHQPSGSHFLDRCLKDLLAVMQERAWAAAA